MTTTINITAHDRLDAALSDLRQAQRDAMDLDDQARHVAALTLMSDVRKIFPRADVLRVYDDFINTVLDEYGSVIAGDYGEPIPQLTASVHDKAVLVAGSSATSIDLERTWLDSMSLEEQIAGTQDRIVPADAAQAALTAARHHVYEAAQAALVDALRQQYPEVAYLCVDPVSGQTTEVYSDDEKLLGEGSHADLDALIAHTEPYWMHGGQAGSPEVIVELKDLLLP